MNEAIRAFRDLLLQHVAGPSAAGMVAALPHTHYFGPAPDLEALGELLQFIGC